MSINTTWLVLRLQGPMQSWGFDSRYNQRNTGLMPTKSAVAGMCCAALGLPRGSIAEREFIERFSNVGMTAISVPREKDGRQLRIQRLVDYHTVGGGYDPGKPLERPFITATAEKGGPRAKDGQALAVLTNRQYLLDSQFGVLLEGDSNLIERLSSALENPVWGIWLGRKSCIPSAPVLIGVGRNREQAIRMLLGDVPIDEFTRQEDADGFEEGSDSLPDNAVAFVSDNREFAPRRVRTVRANRHS